MIMLVIQKKLLYNFDNVKIIVSTLGKEIVENTSTGTYSLLISDSNIWLSNPKS